MAKYFSHLYYTSPGIIWLPAEMKLNRSPADPPSASRRHFRPLLAGAIVFAAWLVALFFWTFWKKSRDRLFACFAAAFFILGVERRCLAFWTDHRESYFYLIRLAAFLMIIHAIIDKNRSN